MRHRLLVILPLLFVGCAERPSAKEARLSQTPYRSDSHKFTINFPDGWEVKDAVSDPAIVKKARFKNRKGQRATLIIYAWVIGLNKLNWDAQTPHSLFTQTYASTSNYLDGGETEVGGSRAIWFKFKHSSDPIDSYAMVYAIVRGDTLFSFFGQTLPNDPAWFDENEPILIQAINSLRFFD